MTVVVVTVAIVPFLLVDIHATPALGIKIAIDRRAVIAGNHVGAVIAIVVEVEAERAGLFRHNCARGNNEPVISSLGKLSGPARRKVLSLKRLGWHLDRSEFVLRS